MMIRWALGCVAAFAAIGNAAAQSPVERGSYLVNTIMTCGNCHTPKGPPAAVAGKDFSGGLSWDEPPFKVTASNITPDRDTGIGAWSAADIKKALLTGVRPSGVPLAPIMPSNFYGILTPGDLDGIVAYLQSLTPVKNAVPTPEYRLPSRFRRQGEERLLPRHHRPLHGMSHSDDARSVGDGLAGQGRARIPRAVGRVEVEEYHLAQDRRYRRLDRHGDQDGDHPGQA
jgi:mono/diheme cytochrome c family protein